MSPSRTTCETSATCGNFAEKRTRGWLRHFSVQNVLMVMVALFQLGSLWEGQQNTNGSLAAQISTVEAQVKNLRLDLGQAGVEFRKENDNTYVRKDVLQIQLAAIEGQLFLIKEMVRDELRPYGGKPSRTMDR